MMDTTKMVVGQKVTMLSGVYWNEGEVIEFVPEGVNVKARFGVIMHFDHEGVGRPDGNGTYECGPFIITDICPHVLDSDGYHCRRCWCPMADKPWGTTLE